MKIILNAVRCIPCKRVLISVHRHDFVSCPHIFTDGGNEYIRRGHTQVDFWNWDENTEDLTLYRNPNTLTFHTTKDLEP